MVKLEQLLTHKIGGYFIFLFFMWLMFFCTFILGAYPQKWILWLLSQLTQFFSSKMTSGYLLDFINNGVISGVGSVLAFLPNILILFFFTYIFEETGYMQRVAKIFDALMHKIGLHGNSLVPILMGFGCNVPAILATKTITEKKRKILTMLLIPFMPCSARLPVLVLLIGTFFPQHPLIVLFSLYAFAILITIITALLLDRFIFKNELDLTPVVCTPLCKPAIKKVLAQMWNAAYEYLKKIGTVVLLAMMIIWFLSHFPENKKTDTLVNTQIYGIENSGQFENQTYLNRFGNFIEPVMRPLGFDWKMSVCLVSGLAAKEFIVGTMAVIYQTEHVDDLDNPLSTDIKEAEYEYGPKKGESVFTLPATLSFLVFSMLYVPCIAAVLAIRKESESWKWAFFSIVYSILIAWISAFSVYQFLLFNIG